LLRRELIANVSHDLRNPLAVIHGYIETIYMKDATLSPEDRKKYLEIILNVSEKLKKLVADLFELSKLETDQIAVKKEPLLINELVQDASQSFEILAERKNITIEKEISSSVPYVNADIAMMDRVIQNLLDNAIKYTPENGKVKLQVNSNAEKVDVFVENTGKGIPEEDIPSLFDRYYKANKEESNIEGSGLGLAIAKKILDIHESAITVSSKVGGLTRFSFSLPVMS
jgi:signal transduction histidine kinase